MAPFRLASCQVRFSRALFLGCARAISIETDGMIFFFAQNFFGVHRKSSRYDAGQGCLILGDQGDLSRVHESNSTGIRLLGEQRSPVAIDFNRDGRLDILLAERGNGVFLLENRITD